MFDYLMAWANDDKLKTEGVVAFIGADDKAFCSDQSIILGSTESKRNCNQGNDGVREVSEGRKPKGQEEKKGLKFEDEEGGNGKDKCFSWMGGLKWTGNNPSCGREGTLISKAEVGQMYGLSKGASGFKKLKGSTTYGLEKLFS